MAPFSVLEYLKYLLKYAVLHCNYISFLSICTVLKLHFSTGIQ